MRALYGRHLAARDRVLAECIPDGARVVDVCAGDGALYRHELRHKNVTYLGLDASPQLVAWGRRHGVDMRSFDVRRDAIPSADTVVMQSSLYQFIEEAEPLIGRLLDAARHRVIIAEPIRNLSASDNPLVRVTARVLTRPARDSAYVGNRFNEERLRELFGNFAELERIFSIPGGRELIGIFTGRAGDA